MLCPRCVGNLNPIASGLVERIKDGRGKGRRMEALTKLGVLSLAGFIISDEFRPAILWNLQSIKRSQNGGACCILTIGDNACLLLGCGLDSIATLARQSGHLVPIETGRRGQWWGEIACVGATVVCESVPASMAVSALPSLWGRGSDPNPLHGPFGGRHRDG